MQTPFSVYFFCLWRFKMQTRCLECKSAPLKEWYLWEALLISKSLSLQRHTWILIKEWRYFKIGRTLSFECYPVCLCVCMFMHFLDFISSVLMLSKNKIFLQHIITTVTYSVFLFCLSPAQKYQSSLSVWASSYYITDKLLELMCGCSLWENVDIHGVFVISREAGLEYSNVFNFLTSFCSFLRDGSLSRFTLISGVQ